MDSASIIPADTVTVGTCGSCGGPVYTPLVWTDNMTGGVPPAWCGNCGKKAKPEIVPRYGPIMEME